MNSPVVEFVVACPNCYVALDRFVWLFEDDYEDDDGDDDVGGG